MKTREAQQKELREMAEIAAKKLNLKYGCKKCSGTGRKYFDVELQSYMPCECVLESAKLFTLEKKEKELVS